jgi:hypothetical protein
VVEARTAGVAGDLIASTSTGAEISFDDTTLGTTTAGVDGTLGTEGEMLFDTTNLYLATADNTVSGANWKKLQLQSI